MRLPPFVLLPLVLAGCAGNVADYVGPRSTIISPQLIRYGLDIEQSRCVARRLGDSLAPLQLRRFQRVAAVVREGWSEPGRLTLRDLRHVASSMDDPNIRSALDTATAGCGIAAESPAEPDPVVPVPPETIPVARMAAWLNLGAAPTGQSIAIDAASIEQEDVTRTAWFRLTDPGASAPTGMSYLLRVDCRARSIAQLKHRRHDAAGAVVETLDSSAAEQAALPIEGGTVMEIAWLALCT